MYALLYTLFRLHFCMLKGWLKYGLNTDLINEKSLNVKMTNVGGNSPVFQLFGKNYFFFPIHYNPVDIISEIKTLCTSPEALCYVLEQDFRFEDFF